MHIQHFHVIYLYFFVVPAQVVNDFFRFAFRKSKVDLSLFLFSSSFSPPLHCYIST